MKGGEMFKTTHVKEDNSKKLAILWTSGDPEVAIKMVMMYAYNIQKAKKWDDMVFIIWGPSSKLAANNSKIQEYLKKMKNIGIRLEACKACSDSYGVSEKLSNLGIDVKYMGIPLTKYIQSGWKTITF
jgi:hypothetical protein